MDQHYISLRQGYRAEFVAGAVFLSPCLPPSLQKKKKKSASASRHNFTLPDISPSVSPFVQA